MIGTERALMAMLVVAATLVATPAVAQVVVFPLDARSVPPALSQRTTSAVLRALDGIERLQVIDPKTVEKRLQVSLTDQAQACQYDVFCLVEIGEILETATVLLGHIQFKADATETPYELKLVVLDVDRAAIAEVLIWRIAGPEALSAAAYAAGRRLFAPQDAQVKVTLEPPQAVVSLYGDPQTLPRGGPWSMWAGEYALTVEAEGYLPVARAWKVEPGANELNITLESDPLYVRPKTPVTPPEPFALPSRRTGSGVTARDVDVGVKATGPRSRFARPLPWITAGVGLAAVVTGSVLMATAQSDYNALANEVRFSPVETTQAFVAAPERDDLNARYQLGGGILLGGAAVLIGGVVWLFIGPDEREASTAEISALPPETEAHRAAAARITASLRARGGRR